MKRLRGLQRKAARQRGPRDRSTGSRREPSAGWEKTQSKIARAHHQIANLREDALHKATTRITRTYQNIVIEDLSVRAMSRRGGARKRGLNRAIADASFGTLAWMLTYKTDWAGGDLTRADRFYPSSKTCSGCGAVKAKLPLSDRTYTCDICGASVDRDTNAAINLARLAWAPAGVPGRNAGGAVQKTTPLVAAGNEAGTHVRGSVRPKGSGSVNEHLMVHSSTRRLGDDDRSLLGLSTLLEEAS
jgi:putative transposase